jgi:cysteine dioxygenase
MNDFEQPACPQSNLAILRLRLNSLRGKASLTDLEQLLSLYPPSIKDVCPYIRFSDAAYTRNIISENPFFRLLVLCWGPGQISPIHDHAGSTCAVLVVRGTATETRYTLTAEGLARPTDTLVYGPGTVFGGQDTDIHALGNCRHDGAGLVSLHIYSPPLVHMNLYEAETPRLAWAAAGRV